METLRREDFKERFIDYAIKQSHALDEGNGKKANQYHRKIWKIYHSAKDLNYIDIFKECLNNPNEDVRIWAAGFSFGIYPELARKALIDLSKVSDPMINLSIKAMLESFDNGQWKLLL